MSVNSQTRSPANEASLTASRGIGARLFSSIRITMIEIWKNRLSYLFIAPFYLLFVIFIMIPVISGIFLSFTDFNTIEFPRWVGWRNYQNLLSQDTVFLQHVLPNTFKFALFVGPLGYVCAFLLAAVIAQLPRLPRTSFALAMYAPSLTGGIAMVVIWQVMFTGDRTGYINSFLLKWGIIHQPIFFVLDEKWLLPVMIIVAIWASMGIGFLAILAGILNVDKQLYEAARIDGTSNKLQELWYITIPSMKPQMLFAAIMSIVHTLKTGGIGAQLSGSNPTPNYAGQLMMNHIDDYAFIRFELGYASTVAVVLLLMMYGLSKLFGYLFGTKEGV